MQKSLHFDFRDVGAYEGETVHRIMCNFYSLRDGEVQVGQSQLVSAPDWPTFRAYLERGGWTYRSQNHRLDYGRANRKD